MLLSFIAPSVLNKYRFLWLLRLFLFQLIDILICLLMDNGVFRNIGAFNYLGISHGYEAIMHGVLALIHYCLAFTHGLAFKH